MAFISLTLRRVGIVPVTFAAGLYETWAGRGIVLIGTSQRPIAQTRR